MFICYRREDAAFAASYLYDRLGERFGPERVFKDVDSIPLGDDFVDAVTVAVGACDCLVAVIGPQWLAAEDRHGQRRIDLLDDYVRLELEAALQRGVRIIPLCIDGAQMPLAHQLPVSLAPLVRRNALEVTSTRIRADVTRLVDAVERSMEEAGHGLDRKGRTRRRARVPRPRLLVAAALGLGVLLLAAQLLRWVGDRGPTLFVAVSESPGRFARTQATRGGITDPLAITATDLDGDGRGDLVAIEP